MKSQYVPGLRSHRGEAGPSAIGIGHQAQLGNQGPGPVSATVLLCDSGQVGRLSGPLSLGFTNEGFVLCDVTGVFQRR